MENVTKPEENVEKKEKSITKDEENINKLDENVQKENKINELENKLNKLNQEIKEQEMINIFKKYQVKSEFYDYLKFKTTNIENSKMEDTIKKIIKEQPLFKEQINTGGTNKTIITNQPTLTKSSLLDYKKKNNL